MWNSFAKLFNRGGGGGGGSSGGGSSGSNRKDKVVPILEESAAAATAAILTEIPLLTSTSPRASLPAAGVKLWPHQLAMMARCAAIKATPHYASAEVKNAIRYMEKDKIPKISPVPIGIMNDPPGSGKTYAMLAHIAEQQRTRGSSRWLAVIIVPQNIFTQWSNAVQTFYNYDGAPTYRCCNTYGDIMTFYGNKRAFKDINVLLLNELYAEALTTTINDNKVEVDYLVVDEIDSIQSRMSTPIQANHVWLLSASFDHGSKSVGPYSIQPDDIPYIVCKCSPEFIAESVVLEEPLTEKIVCADDDIQLLMDIVSADVITALNAGDQRALLKLLEMLRMPGQCTVRELAEIYCGQLMSKSSDLERIEDVVKSLSELDEDPDAYMNRLMELRKLRGDATLLKERLASSATGVAPGATKAETFATTLCQRMLNEPASKWLIFNDNGAALIDTQRILEEKGIHAAMMDGGNVERITATLNEYRDASGIQVLLLNSRMEGAGINLENTSHLLFMHATDDRLVEQVIGRAQRFGRKGRLRVIGLFNRNELAATFAG